MTKKILFAMRLFVYGLAFALSLKTPVWAAVSPAPQQRASHSSDACLPATCVAGAVVVRRHHQSTPRPRHHPNYHRGTVVVVRPVQPWVHRPYYGSVVAGVVLGTVIVASSIPPAPSPEVCWYWSNSAQSGGYWDYCKSR